MSDEETLAAASAVGDVLRHRHVRQGIVLEHHADTALVRGHRVDTRSPNRNRVLRGAARPRCSGSSPASTLADEGRIRFGDRVVNAVPPQRARGIGMVFQNYALWPHMTVSENVSYGLKLRKVSSSDMPRGSRGCWRRWASPAWAVAIRPALGRAAAARGARARAGAHPQMLLLDEPLSNLDAKIRVQASRGDPQAPEGAWHSPRST